MRSSWLIVARKSLLSRFDSIQGHVRLGQFIDLAVEVGVDLAPLILHVDEVAQHAVERMAQVLELVAGLDFAADIELARPRWRRRLPCRCLTGLTMM